MKANQKFLWLFLTFVFTFCIGFTSFSQQATVNHRPKLGLVLSGGGAKGFAHVGVIKVMEEAGLHVDYIGGTSMGSVIGGLYATGYSPDMMAEIIRHQDWDMLLSDKVERKYIPVEEKENADRFVITLPIRGNKIALKQGLHNGQMINMLLAKTTSPVYNITDFKKLPTPFVCIGTDLTNGENVTLTKGSLAKALRASMAIPSFFTPVEYDGRLLVDGGVVNNYPVKEVKDMGADIIIGIDIQSDLYTKDELNSMVRVLDQITSFHRIDAYEKGLANTDIYLKPDLAGYDLMSFTDYDSIIKAGELSARAIFPQLKRLADSINSLGAAEYKAKDARIPDSIYITSIQYIGLKNVSKNYLEGSLKVNPQSWILLDKLNEGVIRAYASGFFESVDYSFLPDVGGATLVIEVSEGDQGILGVGIHYDSDYKVALLLNATFKNVVFKGSKLFIDAGLGENTKASVFYLIDRGMKPGFGVKYTYFNLGFNQYEDGSVKDVIKTDENRIELFTQLSLRHITKFKIGLEYEYFKVKSDISTDFDYGFNSYITPFISVGSDSYDRSYFSTTGTKVEFKLKYVVALSNDWMTDLFQNSLVFQIKQNINFPVSKKSTFKAGYFAGFTLQSANTPYQHQFIVGGQNNNTSFDGFISFNGLRFIEKRGVQTIITKFAWQYNIYKAFYITPKIDAGFIANDIADLFTPKDFMLGYGMAFGYNSFIGPIEFTVMGSNYNSSAIGFINIGYSF